MDSMDVRCRACDLRATFVYSSTLKSVRAGKKQCIDIGATCELFNTQQMAIPRPQAHESESSRICTKKPLICKVVLLYR